MGLRFVYKFFTKRMRVFISLTRNIFYLYFVDFFNKQDDLFLVLTDKSQSSFYMTVFNVPRRFIITINRSAHFGTRSDHFCSPETLWNV